MATVAVQREKLYEQVWSIPVSQLSIMYGISDVGLAKVCRRYQIPRPPRGYWARKAVGQMVKQTPLPKAGRGMSVVEMKGWNMNDQSIQALVRTQGGAAETVLRDVLEESPPHSLVTTTKTHVSGAQLDHENLIQSDGRIALDVHVSRPVVDRCMSVLDLLIKKWESSEGTVRVGGNVEKRSTVFAIGPDELYVRIVENIDESKPITDSSRLTGKLILQIGGQERNNFRRRWADTKTQRLEKMIKPLTETMLNVLVVTKAARLDAECVERQQRQAAERRKADATRDSKEFYWRQELMTAVGRWHAAHQIRAYLDDMEKSVADGRSHVRNEQAFKQWMTWCRRYVQSIDPIANVPLPSESTGGSTNTLITEIEFTSSTRPVIAALNVVDTDQLERVTEDEVRAVCRSSARAVWSEITRVLDGFGYPVSKRRDIW